MDKIRQVRLLRIKELEQQERSLRRDAYYSSHDYAAYHQWADAVAEQADKMRKDVMSAPIVIAVVIDATIDTGSIWARCPWPSPHFPHGFEFSFESLGLKKIEECEDKEDVGDITLNPDADCPWVMVRVDDPNLLPPAARADCEDGMLQVPWPYCLKTLGVSHFKLIDLLLDQRESEIEEALTRQLVARDYTTIRMLVTDGVYTETRQRADGPH